MMMALAGVRDLPGVLVPGGVTLPPRRRRGRRQGPVDRRPLRARRDHAAGGRRAGLPRLRHPGRRLPVPRHRRDVAGRRRGARAWPCRTRPWPPRASRSGCDMARRSARALVELSPRGGHDPPTSSPTPRSATRWPSTPRSAARRTCCCTSRRSPSPPACRGRPSTTGTRSTARVPAARRRAAQRPGLPPDRPRLPRRRRPRGHAPPARTRAARRRRALTVTGEPLGAVLDWWETVRAPQAAPRAPAASGRRRPRRRDHEPRTGARRAG